MKIVLAPDSFKDCLTASEVCAALTRGIYARVPEATVVTVPMADGGEGTMEALRHVMAGQPVTLDVAGPLGHPVEVHYGFDASSQLALIEAAQAAGLEQLPAAQRNPFHTTTYGVGEMLRDALSRGARHVIVTIGGTATVDGGTGLARALGYRFLDASGAALPEGGGSLVHLDRIIPPDKRPWEAAEIEVACDVTNPLLGEHGAAKVFGPQKGAEPAMVDHLEAGLQRLAEVMASNLGTDPRDQVGAGAAGGLGAGLAGFARARLRRGVELVMERVGLAEALAGANLVITGEGRTDSQSAAGKVCAGVGRLAAAHHVPCVVLSGAVEGSMDALHAQGVTAVLSIAPGPQTLAQALETAADQLARTAGEVAAVFFRVGG